VSYAIEAGIPLPVRGPKPPHQPKQPGRQPAAETTLMQTMEVGESFLVDDYMRWLFLRGKLTKMRPRRFSMRKVPGGWRLWRTE
jgi:hypothetical protein